MPKQMNSIYKNMADTNSYNVPAEGWGYYLNDEEKARAQERAYQEYVEEKKTERLIRKLTALAATIMKAQDNMYFNDGMNGKKDYKGNGREGQATNQQDNAQSSYSQVARDQSQNSKINEELLVDDTEVDYTSELLRRAREFCRGKNVDGIPLYTGMRYVPEDREPKRKDGEISEDTINRELLFAFKASDEYDLKTVTNVRKILSDWLSNSIAECFKEFCMTVTIICCPASSKDATQVRWWRFTDMVVKKCEEQLCNIQNGFNAIQFIKDADIPSHFNKGNAKVAQFRYKNLKGKNVVLVDDICASRNTLRRNIKMIQKAGGHVVACFVFADSNPE